jgi:alanine-synthesizing transaminase
MFSSRVPPSLAANAVFRALRAAQAAPRPLIDLTLSNPTTAGFEYPPSLLAPLQSSDGRVYEPSPLGLPATREAVARDYARRGIILPAERIVLTSSTSEAYSILFKLLCEPSGDNVLTPAPSYPLFDHLTRLDGVACANYALEYHGRWALDRGSVEAAWTARTRAVLAVSPNNPTGSCLSAAELDALGSLCGARDGALVLDEVFADYPLGGGSASATTAPRGLIFRLGGLSKSAGLPQVKLGWIGVEGPDDRVAQAFERLEFICDAYLSVSTPVQAAAPALIENSTAVRRQILERVRTNYGRLRQAAAAYPAVDVLHADAGWSAVLRVPARTSEEDLVLELLERDGVIVHPGFFFDFPHEAFLVLSLLPEPPIFDAGVARIFERAAG